MKMPQNTTTIKELPFFDRTTYKDNFMSWKPDNSNTDFVKNIQQNRQKIGVFLNVPFLAETHNASAFKPYKIGKRDSLLKTPANLVIF